MVTKSYIVFLVFFPMRKSDLVVLIVLVALFGFSSWLLFSSGNESSVTGDVVFGGDINGEFGEEIGE